MNNLIENLKYRYLAYRQIKHIKNMKCDFEGCNKKGKYLGFYWHLCPIHLLVVYGVKPNKAKELLKIIKSK